MQTVLNDLSGCSLDSNLGYTVITLKLFQVKVDEPKTSYNIILYLIYDANRVRPHKMTVDSSTETTLPKDVELKCRTYFKHFKRYELKKAFEETHKAIDSPVRWMKGQDEDELDLNVGKKKQKLRERYIFLLCLKLKLKFYFSWTKIFTLILLFIFRTVMNQIPKKT